MCTVRLCHDSPSHSSLNNTRVERELCTTLLYAVRIGARSLHEWCHLATRLETFASKEQPDRQQTLLYTFHRCVPLLLVQPSGCSCPESRLTDLTLAPFLAWPRSCVSNPGLPISTFHVPRSTSHVCSNLSHQEYDETEARPPVKENRQPFINKPPFCPSRSFILYVDNVFVLFNTNPKGNDGVGDKVTVVPSPLRQHKTSPLLHFRGPSFNPLTLTAHRDIHIDGFHAFGPFQELRIGHATGVGTRVRGQLQHG